MNELVSTYISQAWKLPHSQFASYLHKLYGLGHITEAEQNEMSRRHQAPAQSLRPQDVGRIVAPVSKPPTSAPGPELTYAENVLNAEIQNYRKAPTVDTLRQLEYHVSRMEEGPLREFYRSKLTSLPAPKDAPQLAEWAKRAMAQPPVQAGVNPFTPENVLRVMDIPRGVVAGTVEQSFRQMRGQETIDPAEIVRRAVSGESPSATKFAWQMADEWSRANYDPNHPTASFMKQAAVQVSALGLGLVADALSDPMTWVFAGFSGGTTGTRVFGAQISPKQAASEVGRALQKTLEPTLGKEQTAQLSRDLLAGLRQRAVYYDHIGQGRPGATVEAYAFIRDQLKRRGIAEPEQQAAAATKALVNQLKEQPRWWGRAIRPGGEPVLHPDIASDIAAAERRARPPGTPETPDVTPAQRVGKTEPGVAPREVIPADVVPPERLIVPEEAPVRPSDAIVPAEAPAPSPAVAIEAPRTGPRYQEGVDPRRTFGQWAVGKEAQFEVMGASHSGKVTGFNPRTGKLEIQVQGLGKENVPLEAVQVRDPMGPMHILDETPVRPPTPAPVRPVEPAVAPEAPTPRPAAGTPPEAAPAPAAAVPETVAARPPTVPETPAAAPRLDSMEAIVARSYERAGMVVPAEDLKAVTASVPKPELKRGVTGWLSDVAVSQLDREWQDALVSAVHEPRAIEGYYHTIARRLSQAIRRPTEAARMQAYRAHPTRGTEAERLKARALSAAGLLPEDAQPIAYVRRLQELPAEAQQILDDAEAFTQYAKNTRLPVPEVMIDDARLSRLTTFQQTQLKYDRPMLDVQPEERLAAALVESKQLPEGADALQYVRDTFMEGDSIKWRAVPRSTLALLQEADRIDTFFAAFRDKVVITPKDAIRRLRSMGDTQAEIDFGLISSGYLPQMRPREAMIGGSLTPGEATPGRFGLHAEYENIWSRLVDYAKEGREADVMMQANALMDMYVTEYGQLLRRLKLYEVVKGNPAKGAAEPGLGKLVTINSPEAKKLTDAGWRVMSDPNGQPLPGMIETEGERVWLVPREFARQYMLRTQLPGEVFSTGVLQKAIAGGRSWFVNLALTRLPFIKLNWGEQLQNYGFAVGPQGMAEDVAQVLAAGLKKATGKAVSPEELPDLIKGMRAGAELGMQSLVDSFTMAPPQTAIDYAEKWLTSHIESVIRRAVPGADDVLVKQIAEESWSVRGSGNLGQIRAIEEETGFLQLRGRLADLGMNLEDIRKVAGATWSAVEDGARLGLYATLRAKGYSPSGARRGVFSGFVGYMREMYPMFFAMMSNFGLWFMRYNYGRGAQLLTRAINRPVYPYALAQSYQRQDQARAEPYGPASKQWLLLSELAKRKGNFTMEWHPINSGAVPEEFYPTQEQAPLLGQGQGRVFFQRMRFAPEETTGEILRFLSNPMEGLQRYADPYLQAYTEAMESGKPGAERAADVARKFPGAQYILGERPISTPWLRYKEKMDRQNADRIARGERPLELRPRPQKDIDMEAQLTDARLNRLFATYKWVDWDVMDLTRDEIAEMIRFGEEADKLHGASPKNWMIPKRTLLDALEAKKVGRQLRPFGQGPYSETERAIAERYR